MQHGALDGDVGQDGDRRAQRKARAPEQEAVRGRVEGLFGQVKSAFLESDTKAAKGVLKAADAIGDDCDLVIEQLLGDAASIKTHEAVAYSLLARHYKRVSSHLSNVATAVLGKVEELDFRP